MVTVIAVWIDLDHAFAIERRTHGPSAVYACRRLVRGGRGAPHEDESPESFYFRVLDASHHAHRILILGPDDARFQLQQRAQMYSFLRDRIEDVCHEPDGSPLAVARHLTETFPAGERAPEREARPTWMGSRICENQGSFRIEGVRRIRHNARVAPSRTAAG